MTESTGVKPPSTEPNDALLSQVTKTAAPASIRELADSCVRFVERAVGVKLDYEPETLSVLDHYAKAAKDEAKDRPEALALVSRAVAAYFGEVVRGQYRSFWSLPTDDVAGGELRFGEVYLSFSPFAFACAAIGFDPTGGAGADELALDAGLVVEAEDMEDIGDQMARGAEVSEEEFVLLTTRFDVIQLVADQLKARAERRGLGDVDFEDADYDD